MTCLHWPTRWHSVALKNDFVVPQLKTLAENLAVMGGRSCLHYCAVARLRGCAVARLRGCAVALFRVRLGNVVNPVMACAGHLNKTA